LGFQLGILFVGCEVGLFVWIFAKVVKLLAIFAVADVTPVAVDDGVFARVHVWQEDIAICCPRRIAQRRCE
jgi:hypothetical protein